MKTQINPQKLKTGDTVGILAPSYAVRPEALQDAMQTLSSLGFAVRSSSHLYSDTYGYAGSPEERAEDFNAMIGDDAVRMLLFGGGEVSNEILPLIDYDAIRKHPKIICSYSDSTTLLNAIYSMTGLVTFYGASPRTFAKLTDYNWQSFENRLMRSCTCYTKSSPWKTICPGSCEGTITGGYLVNFSAMLGLPQYPVIPDDPCILLIEDHESLSKPAMVSKWFSNMEQRGAFKQATGLIFGHYSTQEAPLIDDILYRIGERHHIPVVRCEDFGHGICNSIFPLGIKAYLDTETGTFQFSEFGVSD